MDRWCEKRGMILTSIFTEEFKLDLTGLQKLDFPKTADLSPFRMIKLFTFHNQFLLILAMNKI